MSGFQAADRENSDVQRIEGEQVDAAPAPPLAFLRPIASPTPGVKTKSIILRERESF
jgi:hypothetical protein